MLHMSLKFLLRTFGCQMNHADSEKITMLLRQAGASRVVEAADADVVILNTCSVRQKGEDRVFGYLREVRKLSEAQGRRIFTGITGCMTRKTGMAPRHYDAENARKNARTITMLGSPDSIFNHDDPLFARSGDIDFIFRIEETAYLGRILSAITGTDIGADDRYEDYLRLRQSRDDPGSANIIVQTGCDNFCTFCIVPYTRGREISRSMDEIEAEAREAVASGAKQIMLLGQNVNSYGKETRKKRWNPESLTW